MHNHTKPRWALSENLVTSEEVFLNRRQWLRGAGFFGAGLAATALPSLAAQPGDAWTPTPETNPNYTDPGRPVTSEADNTTYNNFYEFGSHKQIWPAAMTVKAARFTAFLGDEGITRALLARLAVR